MTSSLSLLRRFLAWWRDELLTFVPERLRHLAPGQDALLIDLHDDCVALIELKRGARRELGRLPPISNDPEMARAAVLDALGSIAKDKLPVLLDLPVSRALVRRQSLPKAAEEDLHQVVSYELERMTPFKREEVRFDLRVVGRNEAASQVDIQLGVVPHAELDAALNELAVIGLAPERVGIAAEGLSSTDGINLVRARSGREDRRSAVSTLILAAAAVALALTTILLPLELKRHRSEQLVAEVSALRSVSMEIADRRRAAQSALDRLRFIDDRRIERPLLVATLNELSELLPDDVWLTELKQNGAEIEIQGIAPAASGLIRLIEDSPAFENAAMAAQVRRDPRTDRDQFTITFDTVGTEVPS